MKKIIFLLLVCSYSIVLHAQDATDSMQTKGTKIKMKTKPSSSDMDNGTMDNSGKGKMKIKTKDNGNMQSGTTTTTTDMNSNTNGMNSSSTFTNNTRITIQGWRTDPPSLPVIGTNVSPDVVTVIKSKYGNNIYDIKKIRITSGQDAYAVRVMENGAYTTYYVGADGTVISR